MIDDSLSKVFYFNPNLLFIYLQIHSMCETHSFNLVCKIVGSRQLFEYFAIEFTLLNIKVIGGNI
jgi:hypothetical protein